MSSWALGMYHHVCSKKSAFLVQTIAYGGNLVTSVIIHIHGAQMRSKSSAFHRCFDTLFENRFSKGTAYQSFSFLCFALEGFAEVSRALGLFRVPLRFGERSFVGRRLFQLSASL
jgi:hypothetical protein